MDHGYTIFTKTTDREGNKAVAYQTVCGPCEDRYRQHGEILDSEEAADAWLEKEQWWNGPKKMRYFCFNEFDDQGEHIVTLSEEEIRKEYYPYWYKKMCEKYGQEQVDKDYCFEDFLGDWIIVHWAWESKDET
jgi:hypothetical protein